MLEWDPLNPQPHHHHGKPQTMAKLFATTTTGIEGSSPISVVTRGHRRPTSITVLVVEYTCTGTTTTKEVFGEEDRLNWDTV